MITTLRLQHFRNYKDAVFSFGPQVTIIAGPNGSGKTNLLEALLVVARGSSYRTRDPDLLQFGATWARLDAEASTTPRTIKIQTTPENTTTKAFEINGQVLSRIPLGRTIPAVVFEPNHLLLFYGPPDLRRNFLDDLLEQTTPRYSAVRRHYKRVLAQRNNLLKKQPANLKEQLFVWNIRLSELGGQIARQRQELLGRLNTQISDVYSAIAERPHHVQLQYDSRFPCQNYETSMLHKLEQDLPLDIARGFTASGPHRDDIRVTINGHHASTTASRGETRTLILVLKILEAHIIEEVRNESPLLLLDDVFSELDSLRRSALTALVATHQTVITTTDADKLGIVPKQQAQHQTIFLNP